MADSERGFGSYNTDEDLQVYKMLAENFPEFRDWDPAPRPVSPELEPGIRIPQGHIAFRGDFDSDAK